MELANQSAIENNDVKVDTRPSLVNDPSSNSETVYRDKTEETELVKRSFTRLLSLASGDCHYAYKLNAILSPLCRKWRQIEAAEDATEKTKDKKKKKKRGNILHLVSSITYY